MNRKSRLWLSVLTVLAFFTADPALAGGARLYETSVGDMALASAGYVARAQDSSTVFSNPAGMSFLNGDGEFLLSVQPLYGDVSFTPNDDSSVVGSGSDGGNALGVFPGLSAFYAGGGESLRWGVALVGNFGLGLDYEDDWVGRYYIQDTLLLGMTLAPSMSFKLSDSVAIGGSLHAMYGVFDFTTAVRNPGQPGDGALQFDDSVVALGARLGLLMEPAAGTRVGVTYQSMIDLEFQGNPEFSGLSQTLTDALDQRGLLNTRLDLAMKAPQGVMVSFYRDMDDWALMGNAGWEDWSAFGKVDVNLAGDDETDITTLTADRNYRDSWHLALGAQRQLASWRLSFGAAYDSSIVDDEDRTPDLPLGDSIRLGIGGTRPGNGKVPEMTLGYELVWGGDLELDVDRGLLSGRLAGEYEKSAMHFFGISFRWGADS